MFGIANFTLYILNPLTLVDCSSNPSTVKIVSSISYPFNLYVVPFGMFVVVKNEKVLLSLS